MERPVVAIVQARMGSTRRPGKVLEPVLGRPLLALMLERVTRARALDSVVVATTELERDAPIADVAAAAGAAVFRGSENDVLGRFVGAAAAAEAGTVVRLTADCPLIDRRVIDRVVDAFAAADPPVDLATNAPREGRTYPPGMDVEVMSRAALERAYELAEDDADREHVGVRLHRPPFTERPVHLDRDLADVRLTVDYEHDLEVVRGLFETLLPRDQDFSLEAILGVLAM